MSQNNPPVPTPIALNVPYVETQGTPGSALLFIQTTNSDGTAPTLAYDPSNTSDAAATLSQPVANDGSNPLFPVGDYPYMATISAAAVGSVLVDLLSDGIVDQQFEITVSQANPQVANVPPTAIVINPPQG